MHKYFNAFNLIRTLTYNNFHYLFEYNNDLEKVWNDLNTEILRNIGVDNEKSEKILLEVNDIDPDEEFQKYIEKGIKSVIISDPEYPFLLKQIKKPPLILYYKGDISILNDRTNIAVVGTRKHSLYGEFIINNIVGNLATNGFCIVSGLAKGIDTLAHKKALYGNGKTAAVLGSSLDIIYPFSNRSLALSIEKNGVLISEFPLGTGPINYNFPRRNRIISGLSKAVLVVEAPEKSGALITASYAISQNREVFAVPGDINRSSSLGVNRLFQKGEAYPVLSVKDVYEVLNISFTEDILPQIKLSDQEAQIIRLIKTGKNEINRLLIESPFEISETLKIISLLEIRGLIKQFFGRITVLF